VLSATEVFLAHTGAIQIRLLLLLLLLLLSTLIDCTDFSSAHERYFRVDTLEELFANVDSRNIIDFIVAYSDHLLMLT